MPITYTTAGDTSMLLIDVDRDIPAGTHQLYVVANVAGTDVLISSTPDRRSVSTLARLSIMNTASNFDGLDVYLVTTGTSIDDVSPLLFGLTPGLTPIQIPVAANDYEVYVTIAGEKTVVAGPIPLSAQLGGVYFGIVYDTTDPAVADFEFIPP